MKFNRLQASISNNADQSPSLYMAFCAIESLFADLEDNCASDISLCPVGDERLPSKLVWLCRIINEIYRDNSDELQRNRSRLDSAMEKLSETQAKLEESSDIYDRLKKLKEEYAVLEQKLQQNCTAAVEYEKLSAKCRQAKQTLEQLGTFDFAAAEEELKNMSADIILKENAKKELMSELMQKRECIDSLQQETDELQAQKQDICEQLQTLKERSQSTALENAQLQEELNITNAQLSACAEEWKQLHTKHDEAQQNIQTTQAKITEFREENLASKYVEMEAVKEELKQLEDELTTFDSECCRIKDQRNQIFIDIAHKKAENESLNEKLVLSQHKQNELEKEKLCLTEDLSERVLQLETLQAEVDQLNRKTLPEIKELHSQELFRKNELQHNINEAEAQLSSLQDEITKLNERLPELEKKVEEDRVIYKGLAANCAVNSSELENLERQIEELCNNKNEQKLVVFRKQLEEKQQELESVRLECERVKQETTEYGIKLEQLQEEKNRLRDLKYRHEQGVIVTEKQLCELKAIVDNEYEKEVISIEERVKLLEIVRSKLAASVTNMQKILGRAPIQEPISLEDQLKFELRELRLRTDDLRSALVECAHSLKMEEK